MKHLKNEELDEIRTRLEQIESMQSKFGIKLSSRTINTLLEMEVSDPASLAQFDLRELNSVYGAGNKTLGEIKDAQSVLIQIGFEPHRQAAAKPPKPLSYQALDVLYELGFEEGDNLEEISLVDIVAVPGGGPKVVREILSYRQRNLDNSVNSKLREEESRQVVEAIITAMNPRASKVLSGLEVTNLEEFLALDWETLLSRKQCGRETFDQIIGMQNLIRAALRTKPSVSMESLVLKVRNHSVYASKTFY